MPSISYQFDVSSVSNYTVTLHFMAPAVGTGNFIMDIVAEGTTEFSALDINTEAGGTEQALTKTFTVNVSDGALNIDFISVNKPPIVSAITVIE